MNKNELFLESHKTLLEIARWICTPKYIAPMAVIHELAGIALVPGMIIKEEVAEGLHEVCPISNEMRDLLLKTFCDSHAKLNLER